MAFGSNGIPSPPLFSNEKPYAEVIKEYDEFAAMMATHNRQQSQRQKQETAVTTDTNTTQKAWADWVSQKIAAEIAPLTQRINELPEEFAEATGQVIGDMREENEGLRREVTYLRERIDRLTDTLLGGSRQDARSTEAHGRTGVAPFRRVE
jgi:hypothetical protein